MQKILIFLLYTCLSAFAAEDLPPDLNDIGIEEKVGDTLPLNLQFTDESGTTRPLQYYFNQNKPVLFQFVYYSCPMLCNLLLNGFVSAAIDMTKKLGKDYTILTISINPSDTPELAATKRKAYIDTLNQDEGAKDWHFLVGNEANIQSITKALGFKFKLLENGEFSHAAGMMFVNNQGIVKRYLYGIVYNGYTLDRAIRESMGLEKLTVSDKILLFCYRYDHKKGEYVLFAENFMRMSGGVVLLLVGLLMIFYWRKEIANKPKIVA